MADYTFGFDKYNYEEGKSEKLGEGSYSNVFLVSRRDKKYALKIFKDPFQNTILKPGNPLRQEIDLTMRIKHPNILNGLEIVYESESSRLGIVLELGDSSLSQILPNLNYEKKLKYSYQFLGAINYLHSLGYLHCDIKTDNAIVVDGILKLSDLGLTVNTVDRSNIFNIKSFCGSTYSSSPEFVCLKYGTRLMRYINEKGKFREIVKEIVKKYVRKIKDDNIRTFQLNEYYSIGTVLIDIFAGKVLSTDEVYEIKFETSFSENIPKSLREKFPQIQDDHVALLISSFIAGNIEERRQTMDDILSIPPFEGYEKWLSGTHGYHIYTHERETDKLEKYFKQTVFSTIFEILRIYLGSLSFLFKIISLFEIILAFTLNSGKYHSSSQSQYYITAMLLSFFFCIERNDVFRKIEEDGKIYETSFDLQYMQKLFNQNDPYSKLYNFSTHVYLHIQGRVTTETTFDHAPSGYIACRSIKYYLMDPLKRKTPQEYINEISNITYEDERYIPKNSLIYENNLASLLRRIIHEKQ